MLWSDLWRSHRRHALPTLRCFFCSGESVVLPVNADAYVSGRLTSSSSLKPPHAAGVSRGNLSAWTCCHCTAHNIVDPDSPCNIASWEPAMAADVDLKCSPASMPKWHPSTRSSMASLNANGGDHPQRSSLLCRRCLNNLRIQTALVAEYNVVGISPGQIERHRQDLHQRYPILCDRCRPFVAATIKSRNEEAQREIWRSKMDDRQRKRISRVGAVQAKSVCSPSQIHATPRSRICLCLEALTWLQVVPSLFVAGCVITSGSALPAVGGLLSVHAFDALVALCLLHTVASLWLVERNHAHVNKSLLHDEILENPWSDNTANEDARDRRHLSWSSCIHIFAARCCVLTNSRGVALLVRIVSATTLLWQVHLASRLWPRKAAVAALPGEVGVSSARPREVLEGDWTVRLSSEADYLATSDHAHVTASNPVFGSRLTHPQTAPLSSAEADSMDWQPMEEDGDEAAPSSSGETSSWYLRTPQFFQPEQLTGLEALLKRGLVLDEREPGKYLPEKDPREASRRRWLLTCLACSTLAVAVAVVDGAELGRITEVLGALLRPARHAC